MRRLVPRPMTAVVAAALLVAAGGLAPARAAPAPRLRLETLVPPTAVALVALHDVAAVPGRLAGTDLGRLAADPEVAAFLGPLVADARASLERAARGEEPAVASATAGAVLRALDLEGDLAVALLDVPAGGTPRLAAMLDFGERLSRFTAFLRSLEPGSPTSVRGLSVSAGPMQTWHVLVEGRARPFGAITLGTAVLVSDDEEWLRRVASAGGTPVEGSLADTTGWAAAVGDATDEPPLLAAFLDPQALANEAPGLSPDAPLRRWADALGLEGTVALGYRLGVVDGRLEERLAVPCEPGRRSPLALLDGATAPVGDPGPDLARAPRGAVALARAGVRPGPALGTVWQMLSAADEPAAEALVGALEAFRARAGVRIEEVLESLGPDAAVFAAPSDEGGLFPHVALSVGVADPARVGRWLRTAASEAVAQNGPDEPVAVAVSTHREGDVELFDVRLSGARDRRLEASGVAVALDGSRLLLAANVATLRDAVARGAGRAPGLGARADARAALAPTEGGARAHAFLDLGRLLATAYDSVVPALQTVGTDRVGPFRVDWAALPAARVVGRALGPTTATLSLRGGTPARRLELAVRGSVPVLLPALALGVVAAAPAVFSLPPASEPEGGPGEPRATVAGPDDEQRTETVLRRTEAALVEFAARYGALPARLDDLLSPAGLLAAPPRDAWGRPLAWRRAADAASGTLASLGADGRAGTDDDREVEVAVPRK